MQIGAMVRGELNVAPDVNYLRAYETDRRAGFLSLPTQCTDTSSSRLPPDSMENPLLTIYQQLNRLTDSVSNGLASNRRRLRTQIS